MNKRNPPPPLGHTAQPASPTGPNRPAAPCLTPPPQLPPNPSPRSPLAPPPLPHTLARCPPDLDRDRGEYLKSPDATPLSSPSSHYAGDPHRRDALRPLRHRASTPPHRQRRSSPIDDACFIFFPVGRRTTSSSIRRPRRIPEPTDLPYSFAVRSPPFPPCSSS